MFPYLSNIYCNLVLHFVIKEREDHYINKKILCDVA